MDCQVVGYPNFYVPDALLALCLIEKLAFPSLCLLFLFAFPFSPGYAL